jgi:hypothetical protein
MLLSDQWVVPDGVSSRVLRIVSVDGVIADLARCAGAGLVVEPRAAPLGEPAPPLAHGVGVGPEPLNDLFVLQAFGRRQNDPRPSGQALRRLSPVRQAFEFAPFRLRKRDHHRCHTPATRHRHLRCSGDLAFERVEEAE